MSQVTSRILVAADVVGDVDLVKKLLLDEFDDVFGSSNPERFIEDFKQYSPDVLVLAFDSLEKAERYYLGLYRLGDLVHTLQHRTVILCGKSDLHRVYDLCKKRYFDDYVLFWPIPHDAPRLPMAVHHALREAHACSGGQPTLGKFSTQVRRLAAMETQLDSYSARGNSQINAAGQTLQDLRQTIMQDLDRFSQSLSQGELQGRWDFKDQEGLLRMIEQLKSKAIAPRFDAVAAAVEPIREWVGELKAGLTPHLDSVRALQSLAAGVRQVILAVDDDEYQHKLLSQLLVDENVDLFFATSSAQAMATLRWMRPDLIIMDVEMPDIDGVETTRRIKSGGDLAGIPVLMITGHSNKEVVVNSINAGAADFAVKPLNRDIFLTKVRRLLTGD